MQFPDAGSDPGQLLVWANPPLATIELICKGIAPVLVNNIGLGAELYCSGTVPNARLAGAMVMF
jgi:hypothetical protein